jgi:hypothetical protein
LHDAFPAARKYVATFNAMLGRADTLKSWPLLLFALARLKASKRAISSRTPASNRSLTILDKSSMQTQRLYRRYLPIHSSRRIHWVFSLSRLTTWPIAQANLRD